MQIGDARHYNEAAKSFGFWHIGFSWQELILGSQAYLHDQPMRKEDDKWIFLKL